MRVQEVVLENNSKRYILLDQKGFPVISVMKYLKYLDKTGKSSNTQKTYCYSLKHFFTYLDEISKDYKYIRLEDLVEFVGWLRSPYKSSKVTPLQQEKAKRTEKTINLTITVIANFYDYLFRNEEIQNDMLMKQVFTGGHSRYKGFLHHVNKDKPSIRNVLKLKEPRKKVKILTKEQVQQVLQATTNIRDRFLIQFLFETGLRIGEILSLFIEDFIFDHAKGHRIRLVDRGELENGARLKTGEREIYVSQSLMDLYDDYLYEVLDELELDTNFVFVKLRGKDVGKPMEYWNVESLFKRLKKKTGINLHPHLFRHTHATIYYQKTKDIKQVQERLGHSQIQTTMNLYLHPSDEDIREDWSKAQSEFNLKKNN
ncbi:transposase [Bacillus sp. SRB_28]|nr:transposase [Bacillus sp. SRB_28]